MKKLLIFLGVALCLSSCTKKVAYQMVKPLPAAYAVNKLQDATVPVSFSSKDISWESGKLSMEVFSEDLYDAVAVSQLKKGDTIVYVGKPIVVKDIDRKDKYATVNGGIEEGGADLTANEGGTYRGSQMDDHSTYTSLGKVTLPLAKDFVLIDCGENPTDPSDTIITGQKEYLEKVPEYRRDFHVLDTRVRIEKGTVVEVHRHWIP